MEWTARRSISLLCALAILSFIQGAAEGSPVLVNETDAEPEAVTIGALIEVNNAFLQAHYLSGALREGEVARASRDIFHRLMGKFPEPFSLVLIADEDESSEHWGLLRLHYTERYYSPYRMDYTAHISFSCRDEVVRTNYDAIVLDHLPCAAQEDSYGGELNDCANRFIQNLPHFSILP